MLCEKILGKLKDFDLTGKTVEYVDIEWHEAFKKIHRKITDKDREIGIRLDDSVLTRGLFQDDVIGESAMRSETAMHRFSGETRKTHLLQSIMNR